MKEINIIVKYDKDRLGAEMNTRGFDQSNGMLNALEIIGILENLKQQEVNKLGDNFQDG